MDPIDHTVPRQAAIASTRFRVLQSLGAGGMGEVHLAEDSALRRKVAIKSIRTQLCQDPEVLKRIDRECLLHAKIGSHPHIVTLYDRIEEDGRIKLVMEFVEGETLHALIDKLTREGKRVSLKDGITIAVQTLEALARIHAHHIVHRDIKPANIMIGRDDCGEYCAKLMDFGIARAGDEDGMTALTQTGMGGPGTPLYMAPEQIDPKSFGEISPATDVYAMGVMLYQIISGRPPFSGTITEIFNGHLNGSPLRLDVQADPQVPTAFADIIEHALAKRPEARYPSANAFRQALLNVDLSSPVGHTQRVAPPTFTPGSAQTVSANDMAGLAAAAAAGHTMVQGGSAASVRPASTGMRAAAIAAILFVGLTAVAGVGGYYVYNNWGDDEPPASAAAADEATVDPADPAKDASVTAENPEPATPVTAEIPAANVPAEVPAVDSAPSAPAPVVTTSDVTQPTPESAPVPVTPPPAGQAPAVPDAAVPAPATNASVAPSSPRDEPTVSAMDFLKQTRGSQAEVAAEPEPAAPAAVEPAAVSTASEPPAAPADPPKPKTTRPKTSTPPNTAAAIVDSKPAPPPATPAPAPKPSGGGFKVKGKETTHTN